MKNNLVHMIVSAFIAIGMIAAVDFLYMVNKPMATLIEGVLIITGVVLLVVAIVKVLR